MTDSPRTSALADIAPTPEPRSSEAGGTGYASADQREGETPEGGLIGYTFDELRTAAFPPRPALLKRGEDAVMRAGDISMIYAPRGTGKSLLAAGIALAVASGSALLGWHAPEARRVLLIDGEMAAEMIRSRLLMLAEAMGISTCALLTAVAADWQEAFLRRLDTAEGQALIEPHITDDVALVIVDNCSTLFDPESEKDPAAWTPAQEWLLSLRRRGKATSLIHHANRLGGARGHSRKEDTMDVILKLSRPEDYTQDQGARFKVEFEKARGFYGDAAAPFVARLDAGGWITEGAPSVSSSTLRLRSEIIKYLTANPDSTKGKVVGNVLGREKTIRDELDRMAEQGILAKHEGRFCVA